MKMKVQEMMDAYLCAVRLSQTELPFRASYWISRMIAKLMNEFEVAEKKRIELVKKHGVEKKKQQGDAEVSEGWAVPPEKIEEFRKEFDAISQDEIDVEVKALNISVFDGAKLKPADLVALDKLLIED